MYRLLKCMTTRETYVRDGTLIEGQMVKEKNYIFYSILCLFAYYAGVATFKAEHILHPSRESSHSRMCVSVIHYFIAVITDENMTDNGKIMVITERTCT